MLKLPEFSILFVMEPNAIDFTIVMVILMKYDMGLTLFHISIRSTCLQKETMRLITKGYLYYLKAV